MKRRNITKKSQQELATLLPKTTHNITRPKKWEIQSTLHVVCLFQGWDGYWGLPRYPHLPDKNVGICSEFPLHHYGGLGTLINFT